MSFSAFPCIRNLFLDLFHPRSDDDLRTAALTHGPSSSAASPSFATPKQPSSDSASPPTTHSDNFKMPGQYERVRNVDIDQVPTIRTTAYRQQVNAQDDDDHRESTALQPIQAPNSPPPSFRSRASSTTRNRQVNADLADAFGSDDESDDDTDDRQLLVGQVTPSSTTAPPSSTGSSAAQRYAPVPANTNARVVGGGSGSDGVFANMSARPDRGGGTSEKDEQPPVCT